MEFHRFFQILGGEITDTYLGIRRIAYGTSWQGWYLSRAYPYVVEYLNNFANSDSRGDPAKAKYGSLGKSTSTASSAPAPATSRPERILKVYLQEGRIATIILTNPDKPLHGEIRRYFERR